jgi:hypothetical protein
MNIKKLLGGLSLRDVDVSKLVKEFVSDVASWASNKDDTRGYMTVLENHPFYRYVVDPMDVPMSVRDNQKPTSTQVDLQVHPLALLNKIDSYIYDSRAMRGLFDRRDHGGAMALITAYTFDVKYYPDAPISNYASYKDMILVLSKWLESNVFNIVYERNIKKDGSEDKFKLFVALRTLVYLYYNRLFESMTIFNLRNYWTAYNEADRGARTLISDTILARRTLDFDDDEDTIDESAIDNNDDEDIQIVYDNDDNNRDETTDKEKILQLMKDKLPNTTPRRLIRRITNDETPPLSGVVTPDEHDLGSLTPPEVVVPAKQRTVISFKDKTSVEFIREPTRSTITVNVRGGQIVGREYVRSIAEADALQSLFEAIRDYDVESSVAMARYYIQEQSKPKYNAQIIRSVHRARSHKSQLIDRIINVYANIIQPNGLLYLEAALKNVETYVFINILKPGNTPEELRDNLKTGSLWCI